MSLILFILSVAPSLFLLNYIRKLNNYSETPRSLIIKLLISGALIIIPTAILEIVIDASLFSIIDNSDVYLFCLSFVGVALVEESLKFIVLHQILEKNDKHLKTIYDGIIYSVSVAMGFAILETLIYVFIYYEGSLSTAFLRAVTPGHFCFSIFMGFYFSQAKRYEKYNRAKYVSNLMKSILIPTLIHGLYDYCLFNGSDLFLILFVVLLVDLYTSTYRTIKKKADEIFFI